MKTLPKIITTILAATLLVLLFAGFAGPDINYTGENTNFNSADINYMALMIEAAMSGDSEAGRDAEAKRNEKIDELVLDLPYIAFEDLYLLAKIMTLEAGNCPHDECPLGVGEVVLNRVASPEWDMPDTIAEVLTAKNQYYYPSMAARFERARPSERCLYLALRLLEGERNLELDVIYHDNAVHGGGSYVSYKHDGHARLYFSYSDNRALYE